MEISEDISEKYMAALDLGSNSFHLVIANVTQGEVRIRDAISEKVQLAAGIDKSNNITAEAQQRALKCLERYAELLQGIPQISVRVVGTNALRQARNSKQFLSLASKILGYDIEIIGGREEARLIYLGVSHTLADDEGSRLVIDIGGGSTEFIIGSRFEPTLTESLSMGSVSYAQRFFAENVSEAQFNLAVTAARQKLSVIRSDLLHLDWQNCVGASGSIRSIYNIIQKQGSQDEDITLDELYALRDKVLSYDVVEDIQINGISGDRLAILPSGLAILIAIFELLAIKSMRYSTGALREGVLYDLLGRNQHEDVRDRTVQALMERYHVHVEHSHAIKATAVYLLNLLGDGAIEDTSLTNFLSWGALLHQLGLSVSHTQFQLHGSYLIRNSDLPGFSKKEQVFLAAMIRNHRRNFSLVNRRSLFYQQKHDFELLSICLRLAVIFHRGQNMPDISDLLFSRSLKGYILTFPEGWLQENSLLQADLTQEIVYLRKAGIELKLL